MSVFWNDPKDKNWLYPRLICNICYCVPGATVSNREQQYHRKFGSSVSPSCGNTEFLSYSFLSFFYHPSSLVLFWALCFLSSSDLLSPLRLSVYLCPIRLRVSLSLSCLSFTSTFPLLSLPSLVTFSNSPRLPAVSHFCLSLVIWGNSEAEASKRRRLKHCRILRKSFSHCK